MREIRASLSKNEKECLATLLDFLRVVAHMSPREVCKWGREAQLLQWSLLLLMIMALVGIFHIDESCRDSFQLRTELSSEKLNLLLPGVVRLRVFLHCKILFQKKYGHSELNWITL